MSAGRDGRGPADDTVTVVIPTHDRPSLLRRTLATVLAQRDVEPRVVIVDDGSSEAAADAIESCRSEQVTVLRNEQPRGVAAARNRGLDDVSSGWVAFLDDDDLWAPDKLSAQLAAAAAAPEAGWVCGGAVTVDEDLRVLAAMRPPPGGPIATLLLSRNRVPGGASGTMVRTDLARDAGGFDTDLSNIADWDFWIRLALRSPVVSVDRPLTAYLRHTATMSGEPGGVRDEFERIWERYQSQREELGVPASSRSYEWFARRQVRAGRRFAATRSFVTIAHRYRDRRHAWALATASAASPGALVRRWDRQARGRLPTEWRDEAETWLAPLRSFPEGG
ncbi:MAG: hypothetical protein AVDCRST_MAG20-780 [uncultured Acidimicrobiales bacterium]|uniref:Glycosyltransferase 2-like domain-containing protein n=1 Tax=uncultured Acidimicrobiales bacterium TaxID=310071 RepID=A0A6J4HI96_9ACTN|nr:MAG: hypothetical protein AVDCRST_MAG20-780 [uncultured Acidimicrobiales bacterium]